MRGPEDRHTARAGGLASRRAERLVARLGPGRAERLGLRLAGEGDADLFGWWVACVLRAGERREEHADAAFWSLRAAGVLSPEKLAAGGGELAALLGELAALLEQARLREPGAVAARLTRGARSLCERFGGSLERLAGGSPSLEELGQRLVRLAPGFGAGSAVRFLRPLRDRWPAADELPLDPAAHAAAVHLGWLDHADDLETAPGTLRRRLADAGETVPFPRVEEALERLGRAACRRDDTARCPLGADCPAR